MMMSCLTGCSAKRRAFSLANPEETAERKFSKHWAHVFESLMPSRKRVIRTPILGGGFPLSLCPILGNPLGLPPFLLMQQPKIRSLKILRPEKDSILSRFWCGRCSKARRLAKMTSQKMPKFCLFRRDRIALFRLRCAGCGSLRRPSFCGCAFGASVIGSHHPNERAEVKKFQQKSYGFFCHTMV